MEKRLTMFFACLFLSLGLAMAQTKVTGTVVSQEDGEPIIGATILVQGQKNGTVTDADGHFTINVPSGKKIVVSYIGMETQTLTPQNGMKITLHPSAALEEVVVTGMTRMDRRMFTGATDKVNAEDALLNGIADVSRSLEGRSAGVSVQKERNRYLWYGSEDPCAWCYLYLWFIKATVGCRRCHHGGRYGYQCR